MEALTPEPLLMVSDWSDKHRILSRSASAEPGKWRTDRTPYLREIMNCLSSLSPVQEIVFKKASQLGGTEIGNNWVGYIIDHSPAPLLIVQPNEGLAKRYSRQRLDTLIRETPRIAAKVREKKSRDSSNTLTMKEFNGGLLIITGAQSATALKSMPIRFAFLDEIDEYPPDLDGQGDPVKLAEARTRTFARRKIFKVSSPTLEGTSRIHDAYLHSDQRKYYVPCPHCEFKQVLIWERIKWKDNDPETTHYLCINCERKIYNHQKTEMLAAGEWIASNPESKVAGFQISSLYSPVGWFSWVDCVKQFLESKGNQLKLRVFINTVLGETWKEKGDAPDWERLYERRESYKIGTVPMNGLFLTAGIDVQKDRFEIEIVAWCDDKQSYSIDYRVIQCDTSIEKSYEFLDLVMNETFEHESGNRLPIRLAAIDSGFNTQQVYNFVRTRRHRFIAVKGQESQQAVIGLPSRTDVSYGGKKIVRGAMVWPVGSSTAKSELYSWLHLKKPFNPTDPFPPGYCHFPHYPEEYFKMLTAEQLTAKTVRGFRKYFWEKVRERNEALDCRVYARAAASVVGIDRFTINEWIDMKEQVSYKPEKTPEPVKIQDQRGGIPTRQSDFW